MSVHGDAMADNVVKTEPPDDVEEEPADACSAWLPASSVKEEMDIGPTVIQPKNKQFAVRQYKRKPVKLEPLQISQGDAIHISKNEHEPSSSGVHRCTICNESFHLQSGLDLHIADSHAMSLSCTFCSNINKHLHVQEKPHVCEICKKSFPLRRSLIMHIRKVHTDRETLGCNICNRNFVFTSDLKNHIFVAHKKNHCCNICKKSFKSMNKLCKHALYHNEKSYFCDICKEAFTNMRFLSQHNFQCRHAEDNGCNYCSICEHTFSQRDDLNVHVHRHAGIKPYYCNTCKKAFVSIECLTKHQIRAQHTVDSGGNRCNICGRVFLMNAHLIQHMSSHSGEKPFCCDICKRVFSHKTILKKHILTKHSNVRPYDPCRVCNKGFFKVSSPLPPRRKVYSKKK